MVLIRDLEIERVKRWGRRGEVPIMHCTKLLKDPEMER
jgi:hypothetical protein